MGDSMAKSIVASALAPYFGAHTEITAALLSGHAGAVTNELYTESMSIAKRCNVPLTLIGWDCPGTLLVASVSARYHIPGGVGLSGFGIVSKEIKQPVFLSHVSWNDWRTQNAVDEVLRNFSIFPVGVVSLLGPEASGEEALVAKPTYTFEHTAHLVDLSDLRKVMIEDGVDGCCDPDDTIRDTPRKGNV